MKELAIPPAAVANKCRELLRVWAGDGNVHVALAAEVWEDPGAWGILLVDLARHVANAYEQRGYSSGAALTKIRQGFDAEWGTPTDEPTGSLM